MNEILEQSPVFAVEMMRNLGISSADLVFPENVARFQGAIEYLAKHPDPHLFISRARMINQSKSSADKLRHLDEYISLHKSKSELQEKMKHVEEELSLYER